MATRVGISSEYQTVVSESPLGVEITVPCEDETLAVTIDDSLSVSSVERVADRSSGE